MVFERRLTATKMMMVSMMQPAVDRLCDISKISARSPPSRNGIQSSVLTESVRQAYIPELFTPDECQQQSNLPEYVHSQISNLGDSKLWEMTQEYTNITDLSHKSSWVWHEFL